MSCDHKPIREDIRAVKLKYREIECDDCGEVFDIVEDPFTGDTYLRAKDEGGR